MSDRMLLSRRICWPMRRVYNTEPEISDTRAMIKGPGAVDVSTMTRMSCAEYPT